MRLYANVVGISGACLNYSVHNSGIISPLEMLYPNSVGGGGHDLGAQAMTGGI